MGERRLVHSVRGRRFLVTALLHSVTVTMGFAFGLFAVFSMLRYRTEALGIKEMTYLFLVIAMALLAAVGTMHHLELVCLNLLVIVLALVLETRVLLPRHSERGGVRKDRERPSGPSGTAHCRPS